MVDAVDPLQQGPQAGDIVDIAAGKMDIRPQPFPLPTAQIIQHADFVAGRGQVIGQRRPQETGPAGN